MALKNIILIKSLYSFIINNSFYPVSLYFTLFLLSSCSPTVSSNRVTVIPAQPEWLTTKPVSDTYYVGIGHSIKKNGHNYIQYAKKSALEDIASEIKINISSISTLSQLASDKAFHEKYEQIINIAVSDEIQEYEHIDTWEDGINHWVYYRLSKARYHEIKKEQKENAVAQALDLFIKARVSENQENDLQAIMFYFKGLRAIENYLTQPLRMEYEGKDMFLTNEINTSIHRLLDNIQLSALPATIVLNRRMAQNAQDVVVLASRKNSKKPFAALPLKATFEKNEGVVFPNYKTDADGRSKILINKITSKEAKQTINVKVDVLSFVNNQSHTPVYALVADEMAVPSVNILLNVKRPIVYISSVEKNMGKPRSNLQLTNKVKNYLTYSGFTLAGSKDESELWIDINVSSERGEVSGSLYSAYVTTLIKVVDLSEKRELYTATLDRIKNYSLNHDRAIQAAYIKSLEELENVTLPELLDFILQ